MRRFTLLVAGIGALAGVDLAAALLYDFGALSWESAGEASRAAAAEPTTAAKPWPETHQGRLARGWVEAFSSGETSMQTYLEFNLAPSSLVQKSMEERLESYRKLRRQLGALRLVEVASEEGAELRVVLFGSESAERHEATFRFQSEEPRKLMAVELTMRQRHGLFGH